MPLIRYVRQAIATMTSPLRKQTFPQEVEAPRGNLTVACKTYRMLVLLRWSVFRSLEELKHCTCDYEIFCGDLQFIRALRTVLLLPCRQLWSCDGGHPEQQAPCISDLIAGHCFDIMTSCSRGKRKLAASLQFTSHSHTVQTRRAGRQRC